MDTHHIQTALQSLEYSWENFTLDSFIAHVALRRQRPIQLLGIAGFKHSGLCMSTRSEDYIFFDTGRHPTVQLHAILHEVAHLVLNHLVGALDRSDVRQLQAWLRQLRTRSPFGYDGPRVQHEEDEAEYFAFLAQKAVVESQQRKYTRQTDHANDIFIPPFTGEDFSDP